MNLFQFITIASLTSVIAWEVMRICAEDGYVRLAKWRIVVWTAAIAAIARPSLLTHVAKVLGIGRGTDVLLYALVFLFLGTSFVLYAKCIHLQRQITLLVRANALNGAMRSGDRSTTPPTEKQLQQSQL